MVDRIQRGPRAERFWIKTEEGPNSPERNFYLDDAFMLFSATWLPPDRFSPLDFDANGFKDAFVYDIGSDLNRLNLILKSQPAALLGPPITVDMWGQQDTVRRRIAEQFLGLYQRFDTNCTPNSSNVAYALNICSTNMYRDTVLYVSADALPPYRAVEPDPLGREHPPDYPGVTGQTQPTPATGSTTEHQGVLPAAQPTPTSGTGSMTGSQGNPPAAQSRPSLNSPPPATGRPNPEPRFTDPDEGQTDRRFHSREPTPPVPGSSQQRENEYDSYSYSKPGEFPYMQPRK